VNRIKDLHIKPDTLKLIEEKVGKNLGYIGTGENFLNRPPVAYGLRSGTPGVSQTGSYWKKGS